MFSGHCRSVVRRVACQSLLDGPLVQNNQVYVLAGDHERNHHNKPGGSEEQGSEDKKNPGQGCYCPFVLTRNLVEYLGLAGVCVFIGIDVRKDQIRKQLIKEFNSRTGVAWHELIPRKLWSKLIGLNVANVLPIKSSSVTTSSIPTQVTEKELTTVVQSHQSSLRNMVGVALLHCGSIEEGLKFLEAGAPECGQSNFNLGVAHETGVASGKPNFEKAFNYYQKGAELGNRNATFNMAIYYLIGKGPVKKDITRGTQLLEEAKKLGCSEASDYIQLLQLHDQQHLKPHSPFSVGLHSSSSAPNISTWNQENDKASVGDLLNDEAAISFIAIN